MIIVEGMDNTGKTTLAQRLREKFNPIDFEHSPSKESLGVKLHWVAKAIRRLDPRVIYDRYAPISERVYGPLLRPHIGDVFGGYTFDLLRLTLRRNPLIIYCRPPDNRVASWGERQQMNGVKDHVTELLARYDWLMDVLREFSVGSGVLLHYDYTRGEQAFNEVCGAVQLHLHSSEMDLQRAFYGSHAND